MKPHSEPNLILAQCAGKEKYRTYQDAQKTLHRFKRNCGAGIYRCPVCQNYHIGHQQKQIYENHR